MSTGNGPVPGEPPPPENSGGAGNRSGTGLGGLWQHVDGDAQKRAAVPQAPRAPVDRSKLVVLVVDDSPAARYSVARTLQAGGYRTREGSGGADALALASGCSLVILDVHLPDLFGLEVCRLLRARPDTAHVPIVHITAVDEELDQRAQSRAAGADEYLISPVSPEHLLETVDRLCAGVEAEVALQTGPQASR